MSIKAESSTGGALTGQHVLITGGTGFIGRYLVQALKKQACDITLMRRPGSQESDLRSVKADLTQSASLEAAVRSTRPDIVFHLAGFTTPARDRALGGTAVAANFEATRILAETAGETGCDAFVFTGTSEEYGDNPVPFHEDLMPRPLSPYSASKAMATAWLFMLHASFSFPAVILRPFLCYGPGQAPPKLVPSAIRAALADRNFNMTSGKQRRELTYVDDLVAGIVRAGVCPEAIGEIINLGSGDERPVREIVALIYDLVGGQGRAVPGALPERPNDMQRFVANTAKAKRILGWSAQTSLEAGLARTIAWTAQNGTSPVASGQSV